MLTPDEIVSRAIEQHKPVAMYVGFSGGNDSRAVTHWMMKNVPGCEPFHANTGIGIEATRRYVRQTCADYGWRLNEIRAKEDCGQDYDAICERFGFPGPDGHRMMYSRLKERCVRMLVRRAKVGYPRTAKVLIASGVRHDESLIRMGYAGREINTVGGQVWINPLYWWSKSQRDEYNAASGMPENPVARELGMSGECGCGAFSHPGELERWRTVDPSFGERIDRLQQRVLARGFTWSWEGRPPKGGHNPNQQNLFHPLCVGCAMPRAAARKLSRTLWPTPAALRGKTLADLILRLKREYFEQIKAGTKTEEYRLLNHFWALRLEGRDFARIILTLGYPNRDDHERRIIRPWRGFTIKTITHPHFGPDPVQVYAIDVRPGA